MPCLLTEFGREVSARLVASVCRPLERAQRGDDPVRNVKEAQRGAYEVLVWTLSLFDTSPALYKKGIPSTLRQSLNDAYGEDASKDPIRWGMLGKAKWHVLTPGAKYGTRSARTHPPDAARQKEKQEQEDDERQAWVDGHDHVQGGDDNGQALGLWTPADSISSSSSSTSDGAADAVAAEHVTQVGYLSGIDEDTPSESLGSNRARDCEDGAGRWDVGSHRTDGSEGEGQFGKVKLQQELPLAKQLLRSVTTWGGYEELEVVGRLYSRHKGNVDAIAKSTGLSVELLRQSPPSDLLDFARKLLSGVSQQVNSADYVLGGYKIDMREGVAFLAITI